MADQPATIRFVYRGSLPDGTVFDDNTEEPYEIILGRHQVMPVLEEALTKLAVGEEATLHIAAEDAYGPYDEKALQRVPLFKIPNGDAMPEGEIIAWRTPMRAEPIPATVREIKNGVATLDFNHPLAGQDIIYWIKRVDDVE